MKMVHLKPLPRWAELIVAGLMGALIMMSLLIWLYPDLYPSFELIQNLLTVMVVIAAVVMFSRTRQ